jgi:hypothetical protein
MGKGKTPPGSRKKTTKKHTTAIPTVEKLLKSLNRMPEVTKISLGVIKPKLRVGPRRIKIMSDNNKVLLLKMRDTNSLQEVRVYTGDATETTDKIVSFAKKQGWAVT